MNHCLSSKSLGNTIVHWDLPDPAGVMVKSPPVTNARDAGELGTNPGSGRYPGVENGNPLKYSCLENSMDGGDW